MKIKYITLFLLATTLFACKKLNIDPKGVVSPDQAYKTEADVKDLLNGMYLPLADGNFYGGGIQKISEFLSDNIDGSGLSGYDADIYNFRSNPDNGTGGVYSTPYNVIMRANTTLENLNLVTSSATTKNNYQGQALFGRAICHFELVKLFAQPYGYTPTNSHLGIVIKTKSEYERGRSRNTVGEVYTKIIADLMDAQNLLPNANGIYPTKWAAKAFLARVYFQMNKFDSAYKYANDVIVNSGINFDNTTTFTTKRFNNPVSSESIFSLVSEAGQNPRFGTLRNDGNPLQAMGIPLTSLTYGNGATANDRRSAWYSNVSGVYGIKKYQKSDFVLTVVHLTEMKLIRAESAGELNQNLATGIADINDIINRTYVAPATLPLTATAAVVIAKVREQRRLEMIYESGDRLQQIKRIGAKGELSSSRAGAPWNCNGIVLQFPGVEFNINTNFQPNPTGGCL
jgi:starch-binding outer membrane protein, SusD/RagB family